MYTSIKGYILLQFRTQKKIIYALKGLFLIFFDYVLAYLVDSAEGRQEGGERVRANDTWEIFCLELP